MQYASTTFGNLYCYNLRDGTIKKFNKTNIVPGYGRIGFYRGLCWSSFSNDIYFSDANNYIFSINSSGDSLKIFYVLDKKIEIDNISISNNGKMFALETTIESGINHGGFAIYTYNILNNHLARVVESKRKINVGGWDLDDKSFLYSRDSLYEYNIDTNKSKIIKINFDKGRRKITEASFYSKGNIVFLSANYNYSKVWKDYLLGDAMQIEIYNLRTSQLKCLTNDKFERGYLRSYLK